MSSIGMSIPYFLPASLNSFSHRIKAVTITEAPVSSASFSLSLVVRRVSFSLAGHPSALLRECFLFAFRQVLQFTRPECRVVKVIKLPACSEVTIMHTA
jgi:hypothetical protein